MLDDFGKGSSASAGRFGVSLIVSLILFGTLGAGVVLASSMAYRAVAEEDLLQVEFAPAPEPEPPPPPPPPPPPVVEEAPPPPPRGRPRPELEQPIEIPDEAPEESDDELAPPEDPFAPEGEGDPNGVVGGTGPIQPAVAPPPPPEPEPEPVGPRGPQRVIEGTTPPQFDRAAIGASFEIPAAVRSAGIARITVVVRVTVDADGNLADVSVLRGHALIPEENILRAVRAVRFQPARMADGTPYAAIHTIPITLNVTL